MEPRWQGERLLTSLLGEYAFTLPTLGSRLARPY